MSEPQTMAPELDPVKLAELLRRREAGESFPQSFIREEDPYSAAPEDLVQGAQSTDRGEGKGVAWHFCWPAEWHRSAGGGSSSKRKRKVTVAGETTFWHPETGKQPILGTDGKSVGAYMRTLSYLQKIKNPPGQAKQLTKKRLGWSIVEIWLDVPHQGLVLYKLYRTHQAHTNPETSTETSVPCPALEPAPSGAEIEVSRVAIVRNGSAAGAAVTIVIDLCGSSIQPTQRLKDLANNVRGLESPAVVVSAMGNTTNIILMAACKALRCGPEKVCEIHEVMLIKELYLRTTHELGLEASTASGSLDLLERQLQHIAMNKRLTFSIRDYLVSFGEITSTKIFSDYLNKLEGTLQVWKLHAIATSGRGSTHLTSTTTDIALESREIQVWKDVDGIFSCDPKVCADATLVPCLTFDEAAELSDFAEQSMKQAMEYRRSIRVRNPYNPLVRGTVITETRDMSESALTSIFLKSNTTVLDIKSKRMIFQTDFVPTALSKFQHFEYLGISVDCTVTLDGKMTLTLTPPELLSKELIKLEVHNVVEELQNIAEVHPLELDDVSAIFLIGNPQESSSIQEKALSVLRRIDAKVYNFSQESSKVLKASMVVDRSRAKDCVQALHSAFFEKRLVSEVRGTENIPQLPVYSPRWRWQETCPSVPEYISVPEYNPYAFADSLFGDDYPTYISSRATEQLDVEDYMPLPWPCECPPPKPCPKPDPPKPCYCPPPKPSSPSGHPEKPVDRMNEDQVWQKGGRVGHFAVACAALGARSVGPGLCSASGVFLEKFFPGSLSRRTRSLCPSRLLDLQLEHGKKIVTAWERDPETVICWLMYAYLLSKIRVNG